MIASVDIAGPGFINIRLAPAVLQSVVAQARAEKGDFGKSEVPEGERKINLEYISANPTGPMHVGHGRWAALGDATARVMRHAGYDVYEEFYINDHGTQMDNFGESVAVRYQQLLGRDVEMPENCYAGAYVKDIAQAIIDEDGDQWLDADPTERMENFRERAYAYELAEQHRVTERFGTTFDCWFSERSLYVPDENGQSAVDRSLKAMDEKGYIYVQDGATWFRSSAFDDEKDRVLIKANGEMTYFMSDVAYHYNKMERGFDHLINIWGADHHGYIARCEAMLAAWGWPGALEIMLGQLVNLFRDGEAVRMSKRTGEMITFEELIDEVGVDATRYLMLAKSSDQPIDFDIEVAKKKDASNPVYYVQYAHARICSILRKAADPADAEAAENGDITMDELAAKVIPADVDLSPLTHESGACPHAQDGRLRPAGDPGRPRPRRVPPHALRAGPCRAVPLVLHELPRHQRGAGPARRTPGPRGRHAHRAGLEPGPARRERAGQDVRGRAEANASALLALRSNLLGSGVREGGARSGVPHARTPSYTLSSRSTCMR